MTRSTFVLSCAAFLPGLSVCGGVKEAQLFAQCPPDNLTGDGHTTLLVYTSEYSLSAGSATGAQGDVVGVTVALQSQLIPEGRLLGMELTICHDPSVAELVGRPSYTDEFLALLGVFGAQYQRVEEGAISGLEQRGHGFILDIGFNRDAYAARFPSPLPIPIMTVYYRLVGSAGTSGALSFCNGALSYGGARCNYNRIISTNPVPQINPAGWEYVSTVNSDGLLTVVPGPVTNPDRPPEPPEALTYPELPSAEEVNLRIGVTSMMAPPGARGVPVEIFATADVEYTGVLVPLDFDERHLHLTGAEVHVVSGVALQDNNNLNSGAGPEEGNAVIFSGLGVNSRRLAEAGQSLHLATLYFDVLESADGDVETALNVVPVMNFGGLHEPFIFVRHVSEIGEDGTWTRVDPVVIQNGEFAIRREVTNFMRGDANGDLEVNITDPVSTLNYLFLSGRRPHCFDAADANDDGDLNITDPVRTLSFLFKGGQPLPPPLAAPGEDPTPDALGCLYRSAN